MVNKKLITILLAAAMSFALVACGGSDASTEEQTNVNTEEQTDDDAEADQATEEADDAAADQTTEEADDAAASTGEFHVSSAVYGPDYGAAPEDYVGKWVLSKAYTAEDGDLEVPADACYLEIEVAVDANKLVDEAAYIHADAKNLKGTMTFNHEGIDSEGYSCTGAWSDWSVVNVVGEGEAYFNGAVKFKVRDDDEGVYFDVLTGTTVEDMELFDVLGMTADGQLVLGYSEEHIEKSGDDEWAYAYIFTKAE